LRVTGLLLALPGLLLLFALLAVILSGLLQLFLGGVKRGLGGVQCLAGGLILGVIVPGLLDLGSEFLHLCFGGVTLLLGIIVFGIILECRVLHLFHRQAGLHEGVSGFLGFGVATRTAGVGLRHRCLRLLSLFLEVLIFGLVVYDREYGAFGRLD